MYRIGELARQFDIKPDTLRFYEKHSLLSPGLRSPGGYRLYSEDDRQRLQFILRAKQVGFTLGEISELLAIEVDRDAHSCMEVKQIAEHKLTRIEAQIAELQQFHQALSRISAACCGGPEAASHCTILQALDGPDSQHEPPQTQQTQSMETSAARKQQEQAQ